MADTDLIGTWRMVSWTRRSVLTGETSDAMGPAPIGYIAYHADGHMMATVFHRHRPQPGDGLWSAGDKVALFDSMLAYVARYTVEGHRVIHHVEAAWDPTWAIDLSRPFTLAGERLEIHGAPGVDPATGEPVIYRMEFTKVRA